MIGSTMPRTSSMLLASLNAVGIGLVPLRFRRYAAWFASTLWISSAGGT
jgi:hypothetical protein